MISRAPLRHIRYLLLGALFAYLPFSAWLVSITGNDAFSLVRDILVAGIVVTSLVIYQLEARPTASRAMVLLAILAGWMALSYMWREASPDQWVRGLRFLLLPLAVLGSLHIAPLTQPEWRALRGIVLLGLGVILFAALLEIIGYPVPMYVDPSVSGALIETHQVGMINIARLQAILAGPNALGLYLLAALGWIIAEGKASRWLIIAGCIVLVLTYSRSSILGLLLFTALSYGIWVSHQKRRAPYIIIGALLAIATVVSGISVYQKPELRDLITHYDSSSQRVEQYQRIWDTRSEIGLWGRGAGTAGPASQYRRDGGPNRWTENSYLDFYEEYGLVGLVLFLTVLITLTIRTWKSAPYAAVAVISFLVAGLFLNFGTGQVGLFLSMAFLGQYSRRS